MPNTHNIPKLARAVWNRDEKACDALWSSALTFICALADAVLIMHSTRKLDGSPCFCAKKKNLKFGAWPPDAMQ